MWAQAAIFKSNYSKARRQAQHEEALGLQRTLEGPSSHLSKAKKEISDSVDDNSDSDSDSDQPIETDDTDGAGLMPAL